MALKYNYRSIDEIPEGLRDHYQKGTDGQYYLDGFAPKDKFEEFRETNRKLYDELNRVRDIDPEKYREATERLQAIENEKLAAEGKYQEALANQKKAWEDKHTKAQKDIETLRRERESMQIELEVNKHIHDFGVPKKGTMKYIMHDIREAAGFDEKGGIIFKDNDGGLRRNKETGEPLSIREFLTDYASNSPLFEESRGASVSGTGDAAHLSNFSGRKVKWGDIDGKMIPADMIDKIAKGQVVVD